MPGRSQILGIFLSCCSAALLLSMKTRWLAFAVASSQLVAVTRYNDERCVSVQLQVGVLEGRCRCRCDVVFQVTIARSENTPSSAPPCSGRLHAHVERARGGGPSCRVWRWCDMQPKTRDETAVTPVALQRNALL